MNDSIKHHLKIILGAGILFGAALLFLQHFLKLSDMETWRMYLFLAVVILGSSVLVNLIWQFRFMRKLKQINRAFKENNDIEKFIRANEELFKTTRSPHFRSLLQINLSAAAARKNDYKKGMELLLEVDLKKLSGINKAVYYCNLIHFYFKLDEKEEALRLMKEQRKLLQRWEDSTHLQVYILIVRQLERIANGRFDEAEKYLPELETLCTTDELREELTHIRSKLSDSSQNTLHPLE